LSQFPSHPNDLTADWLGQRLVGAGIEIGGEITEFSWEAIGTGQVGDSVRIDMAYSGAGTAPNTLVAKFPAADPVSRGTGAMMGLYTKEVQFYREAAPVLDVRTPEVFVAEVSADGSEFVLLFEDLGPARVGNQIAGCTLDDAREAIRQAAAFHAPSWNNSALLNAQWIQPQTDIVERIAAMYPQAQATFRDRYSDALEPEFMALCEEFAALGLPSSRSDDQPQCLVHGDFRLDNMLFGVRGGAEPIAILDWQTVTIGKAMTDIGYFLGCGIGDELRRAHEDELLDLYLAEMGQRGITLAREDIWRDYRIGALHGLSTAVFSAAFVERTERGDANFLSMARGACALALAHDSLAALEEPR